MQGRYDLPDQNSKILINEMLLQGKNFSGWKFRPPSSEILKSQ